MIAYTTTEARPHHCGALIHKLRSEQRAIALGLGVSAHKHLRLAFDNSGITRAWVDEDGSILALMGVSGPLLMTEGTVWAALSQEATRYPIQIVKQAKKQLMSIMLIKHRLYADPFVADPISIRFAKRLGFVELPDMEDARRQYGVIPMVLQLNFEAYVGQSQRMN